MTAYFQRSESLRWTPYLEECLDLLAEKREYPGDELLIHLVRLSLINEKLAQAISHENLGDSFGYVRAPPTYYLRELQSRLRDCGHNTPVDLQQNGKSFVPLRKTHVLMLILGRHHSTALR